MKKWFLLWATLFILTPAFAAPPSCYPDISLPFSLKFGGVSDKPEVGQIIYAASTVGLVWGYTCTTKEADGTVLYHRVIAAGPWEDFPKEWLAIADAAMRGTKADRDALWNKYSTATEWDARLKPDIDAVWAKLPLPPPVAEWKVLADPFRLDKKRLIYNVSSGRRGTSTGQYIDAGAPCDPVTTITEFGPAYFLSVNGNPNTVARCTK